MMANLTKVYNFTEFTKDDITYFNIHKMLPKEGQKLSPNDVATNPYANPLIKSIADVFEEGAQVNIEDEFVDDPYCISDPSAEQFKISKSELIIFLSTYTNKIIRTTEHVSGMTLNPETNDIIHDSIYEMIENTDLSEHFRGIIYAAQQDNQ